MLIVALSWGIIPFLGAIPFVAIASYLAAFPETPQTIREFQYPLNAVFEAVSGFTSTGLTMALDSSKLPHSLQWWRSFMEWIGGVGVIVLMLSVLEPSTAPYQLYQAGGRQKKNCSYCYWDGSQYLENLPAVHGAERAAVCSSWYALVGCSQPRHDWHRHGWLFDYW
jgi:Trk-type K+ transport system membrane component